TWANIWILLPWSNSQDPGWGKSHHVFGDYITQNVMMSFFVIISIQKSINKKNISDKICWAIISILAGISITHLSQGRSGLILLITGLISYAVISVRGKKLWVALAGIIIISIIAIGSSSIIQNRLITAYEEAQRNETDHTSSIGHRLYNYKLTPPLILEKPILGHGTGSYHIEVCKLIENKDLCPMFSWHPHNQFLFFGVDHGIIGIILYIFLIFSLYYIAFKSINYNAKILLFPLTTILVVDSLFNSPLFSSRESQFFIYMIALLVSMAVPIRRKY
ncbi:MAG: O-antigen ligase family protein, partial [Burkholderiaceae bacterium]